MSHPARGHLARPVLLVCVLAACGTPVVVEGPTATPTQVEGPQPIQLHLLAVDAEERALQYEWTQEPASPAGRFSDTATPSPVWLAPSVTEPSHFLLRVKVTNRLEQTTHAEVSVEVLPERTKDNRPPVFVRGPLAPTSASAGERLPLEALARDPDGDVLTYTWRQVTPGTQGTFPRGPLGRAVTWYSPEMGAPTVFTFELTVTDARGASVSGTVSVPVHVPRYADLQAIWDAQCTRCHGPAGRLDLHAGLSHSALLDQQAISGRCRGQPRVKPGDPSGSVLVRRLSGADCGARMPRDRPRHFDMHPEELVRIRSWILGGARND